MTEDAEFVRFDTSLFVIPPNRPRSVKTSMTWVHRTIDAKFEAKLLKMLKSAIRMVSQYLLVPFPLTTPSVFLAFCPKRILHNVLNAKFHDARHRLLLRLVEGAVTIATNMAGRGYRYFLGGNPDVMAEDILS